MVPPNCPLSPREYEVALLLADGLGRDQIAKRLGISRSTVRSQVFDACHKLDAHNAAQLVARMFAAGWIGAGADRAELAEGRLAEVSAQLESEHADAEHAGERAYLDEFEAKLRDPDGLAMGLGVVEGMRPALKRLDDHGRSE